MAINDITLYTDVWTETRNILVAAAPFVTNSTTASTTAASINAAYNDKSLTKPQIVISPIDKDEDSFKFGSIEGRKIINIVIESYYSSSLGSDQLQQQVDYALKSIIPDGIDLIGITSNGTFDLTNENTKVHGQSATYTYVRE